MSQWCRACIHGKRQTTKVVVVEERIFSLKDVAQMNNIPITHESTRRVNHLDDKRKWSLRHNPAAL